MYIENVGKMYDAWLEKQADEYWSECEPEVVDVHLEYEGTKEDGSIEYSRDPIYNCENCHETECEYWKEYNS